MAEGEKKYTLVTLDENIEREPEFYYSREHRLSRASSAVQDLNDNRPVKKSLVKNLFGSRGNAMIFIMLIITCLMVNFVSKYSRSGTIVKLGGNSVTMTILNEEGSLILDIAKQGPKTGIAYTGEVEIAVSPVMAKLSQGETPPVFVHRVVFNQAGYESFQISLPFDAAENEFILLLVTINEQKSVKIKVK